MPITHTWKQFGESITSAPGITLAAYLGDEASIEKAKQHGVLFPTLDDFKRDPHLDPNSHKLDLPQEYVESMRLMMTIILWGAEPIYRAVNALSLLQLAHQPNCEPTLRSIRNDAAFSLQRFLEDRSPENQNELGKRLKRCNEPYQEHENRPDTVDAETVWFHIGAPWFALESVLSDWNGQRDIENEHQVAQAHSTFCHRTSVWPCRTIDAAVHWSSNELTQATVKSVLIRWATTADFTVHPAS